MEATTMSLQIFRDYCKDPFFHSLGIKRYGPLGYVRVIMGFHASVFKRTSEGTRPWVFRFRV